MHGLNAGSEEDDVNLPFRERLDGRPEGSNVIRQGPLVTPERA